MRIKFERINSELERQITYILAREVKDSRLAEGMVTITKVSVTPDLRFAKVYVSIFAESKEARKEVFAAIKNSAGFIRTRLAKTVKMRTIPELHFDLDNTAEFGQKIDDILARIHIPPVDDKSDDETSI